MKTAEELRFTVPDSGLAIIHPLIAATESHRVERIIEGGTLTRSRETDALLRGGVTVEIDRFLVGSNVARIVVVDGWLTGGTRLGHTF